MESRGMQMLDFPAQGLVLALLAISVGLWLNLIWRWRQFGWPLPFRLRRAVPWRPIEAVIVIVIVLFVVEAGLQQIFAPPTREPGIQVDQDNHLLGIQVDCLRKGFELLFIPLVLSLWHLCYWADFGIARREWLIDLQAGLWGVLLAQLPIHLLELPFHSLRMNSPHPILKLLTESLDSPQTLIWMAIQVVVLTPLIEELIFRVIIQGTLCRESPPQVAILLSAATFVGFHQVVDWAPLLPLALILGYVYYRRQSLLAVVVLHGLFNAINLVMAFSSATSSA